MYYKLINNNNKIMRIYNKVSLTVVEKGASAKKSLNTTKIQSNIRDFSGQNLNLEIEVVPNLKYNFLK